MSVFRINPDSQQSLSAGERGFTLIELSIVLVIIGLIVGGVLVGQDLIKAAQIRATVTQLERYNTAANTFRGKYNGLPGDLLNGVNFFASVANQGTVAGAGNGDGLVQSVSAAGTTCAALNCEAGENLLFWYELNQASLIPDSTSSIVSYSNVTPVMGSTVLPNSKVGGQIGVQAAGGINYWVLANISGTDVAGVPTTGGGYAMSLSPIQAYQIDTKIDDGVPSTGTVITILGGIPGTLNDTVTSAAVNCGNSGTSAPTTANDTAYNIATQPNTVNCQLGIRTNF